MCALTNNNKSASSVSPLAYVKEKPFKIAICHQLDNKFCFDVLDKKSSKQFHAFVGGTVGKSLSISMVDKLFLRKKGPKETIIVNGQSLELMHYGKDRNPFRVFGYYNSDNYFTITKIDPKHKTHSN